jgi:hypothetical protein
VAGELDPQWRLWPLTKKRLVTHDLQHGLPNMWPTGLIRPSREVFVVLGCLNGCSNTISFSFQRSNSQQCARASSLSRLHDYTQTHHTRWTPLNEWSARRRDLYLTTQTLYKRQTSMPLAGFGPQVPASQRLQTHALDRTANGIGHCFMKTKNWKRKLRFTLQHAMKAQRVSRCTHLLFNLLKPSGNFTYHQV